jgi:spore coat polysaccharide biosynthesis predicted glycosyltransferase SpsG
MPEVSETWGIRVASSPQHGAGHTKRCLALAAQLTGGVRFFLDCDLWAETARQRGFNVEVEGSPCLSERAVGALRDNRLRGLIFDGYELRAEDGLSAMDVGCVVHLDDGVASFPAHCKINPASSPRLGEPCSQRVLGGLEHALLDHSFVAANERARVNPKSKTKNGRHLLISMGARDSKNVTATVLDVCRDLHCLEGVRVILGAHADHLDAVQKQVAEINQASLVVDCQDMIAEYEQADLALGAGGISLLERLCCGLPSLIIAQSDNQQGNVKTAMEAGAIAFLGESEQLKPSDIRTRVETLARSETVRAEMRAAGLNLVDGRGAARAGASLQRVLEDHENGRLSI